MQPLLKLIPVACVATVVGTVAGYALHGPARETVKACVVTETTVQKSTARLSSAGQATASVEPGEASWKRWPPVTDF
jgi:flagellar motor component MotA